MDVPNDERNKEKAAPPPTSGHQTADDHAVAMRHYRVGRRFAEAVASALKAAATGDAEAASVWFSHADDLLGPLIDLQHAEDVRDFVAGMAHEFEVRIAAAFE